MVLSIDTNEKTITVQGTVMINELISKLNGLVNDWYNYRLVQTEQINYIPNDRVPTPPPPIWYDQYWYNRDNTTLPPYTTKTNIFC